MKKFLTGIVLIAAISFIPTLLIWTPFALRLKSFWNIPLPQNGMATVVSNFDGPLFIVVAKTLYNPQMIKDMFSFPLPTQYYPAHFPLYPLIIKPLAYVLGFPYAMLAATALTSILAIYFFHKFISQYLKPKEALFLTFMFSVFPARWLIVRSVGSSEPLFVAAIIASIYFFQNKKYLLAGLWGAVAQLTKSPAILLFVSYCLFFVLSEFLKLSNLKITDRSNKNNFLPYLPLLLIPISLIGLFIFYQYRLGDFLAYFHSGDNIHLFFPPFQIFNYASPWVGTFWLEEVIFIYLIGAVGVYKLFQQNKKMEAVFTAVFFASTLFVSHRDILRYSLPIIPFLYSAFAETLLKKEFKYAMLIIIIPIYLFSIVYISQNTIPISDWAPLL